MAFEFIPQPIPDVILIKPKVFADDRGFFMETYKRSDFESHGIPFDFRQDNHSKSARGVLRGLHYQLDPVSQGKLVRVVKGRVFDVAVDLRKGSPWFGKSVCVTLDSDSKEMLWVPPGFAHGFCTLEDDTEFLYKTTGEYSPEHERGILFSDSTVAVPWPIPLEEAQLSARDQKLPAFSDAEMNFQYQDGK